MIHPTLNPVTLILSVVIIFLVLLALYGRRKRLEKFSNLRVLPGPRGLPVLGCSHIIGRYNNPWDGFSALRKVYGDVYGLTLGSRKCVVVSSLSAMKEVLIGKSKDFANRPDFLRFHAIFRGDRNLSIALCDWSSKQKTRREIAFPYMHPKATSLGINRMNAFITNELQELVSALTTVRNQLIEPRPFLLAATANIFYQYLCSKRFDPKDPTFQRMIKIYDVVFKEIFQGFAIDFMPWLKIVYERRLKELRNKADEVTNLTATIFDEHEKTLDVENSRDLVDMFLKLIKEDEGCKLSREDAEVTMDDLCGGHSVLGNLWLWGLYLVAGHPEVKEKILKEVSRVTGNQRHPCLKDKPALPYTEAVTLEVLRVVSSPIIPHVASKATSIQGFRVLENTLVMFNTVDLNMDVEYWHEPRRFKPERFLTKENRVLKPAYFFPFGTGKRTCLGDGLVKSTLLLGLGTLVQMFDICLPQGVGAPDLNTIPGVVVPRNEIKLIFRHHPDPVNASLRDTFLSSTP
ncbi:cytochrome P450 307a1-like [Limulus polyphemus]|uniref:Cytochrome P450 307a1-like n=1 Tax=Limulus polyphemus TaxID=6850 RepID=A0ABM1B7D8_LIMPO|nr:cytochrome P450 307a1-like [Limulus polyphemus]